MSIGILLVDDHAVVREGLRALLDQQDDFEVVGEAVSGDAALVEYARLKPDIVLMDMKMPGRNGIETVAALVELDPQVRVLMFTSFAEESQVRDALDAGASGYLLKDAIGDDLLRAVRAVANGDVWLHPGAQRQMLEWLRRPASPVNQLTARERSVLTLLAEGMSNKLIARQLDLTEGTVKGYVSQVLDKLGVADRTQAALLVQRLGTAGRE
jgi:DNA-binding NarL/FixJ family response regulator